MNMFKKILVYIILLTTLSAVGYIFFIYNFTLSDGIKSGILTKFGNRGVVFKTWEGELSQGLSGSQKFAFSVMDNQPEVIAQMKANQGKFVKIEYIERYGTFSWWGETNYYITKVTPEKSPYFNVK